MSTSSGQAKSSKQQEPSVLKEAEQDLAAEERKREQSEAQQRAAEKREQHKQGLRDRLKAASERFKRAHGTALDKKTLDEYMEECRKREVFDILENRLGRLFGTDRALVKEILEEK